MVVVDPCRAGGQGGRGAGGQGGWGQGGQGAGGRGGYKVFVEGGFDQPTYSRQSTVISRGGGGLEPHLTIEKWEWFN